MRAVAGKKYEIEPRGVKYRVVWMRKTEEGSLFPKGFLKPLVQAIYDDMGNTDMFCPREISLRQKDIFWSLIHHFGDVQKGLEQCIDDFVPHWGEARIRLPSEIAIEQARQERESKQLREQQKALREARLHGYTFLFQY